MDETKYMKLLILSDTHHRTDRMQYAFDQCKPDVVLHLGDNISDCYALQRQNPDTVFHMVKGNCDIQGHEENELFLLLEGVKIYMTHGHVYGVKSSMVALTYEARKKGADLALYGHTHKAMIQSTPGLRLMNPGQMERHDAKRVASYGIVTVNGDTFDCDIVYLPL